MTHMSTPAEKTERESAGDLPRFVVVGALIEGLRMNCPRLREKCCQALLAIGPAAIDRMLAAASKYGTRSAGRKHLLDTVEQIRGTPSRPAGLGTLIVTALTACLRFSDQELNTKVSQALIAIRAPGLADYLVRQALVHQKNPRYCHRLLIMAEKVGGTISAQNWLQLGMLTFSRNLGIRTAAERLAWRPRPRTS